MKLLSKKVIKKLIKKKIKISVAESCTGGLLSNSITSIAGSSKVFKLGLIAYSDESKVKVLKIKKKMLKKFGSVSKEVCKTMSINISKIAKTKMSVSITGIAGPRGGSKKKPVGLVYIGIKNGNKIFIKKYLLRNRGRSYIQKTTVNKCLSLILSFLK